MKPITIILPLVILVAGVATFFLLPLSPGVRIGMLASDVIAAGLIGYLLWRKRE